MTYINLDDDDDASFGEIHAQPQSGSTYQGLHGAKGPQGDANAMTDDGNEGGANDIVCDSLQNQVESSTESEDDSGLHDSDNSLSSEKDADDNGSGLARDDVPNAEGATTIPELYGEVEEGIGEEYYDSEELHSCSSTDEEMLAPCKPKYAEFNESIDMQDPHFKIGMKFSSFKQFREAVRNYGIKNRVVMNFRPNNSKRCKAICKKGCPFYLWAAPMIKDRNTIQIKSGNMNHECARDHNIRHVNAKWIAFNYLDQFRADPTWSINGIIQAVRSNQQVDISRLKAWRAMSIAKR